jgi:hypothetical protein
VAFDWEMAGYGIPAPEIAELSGRGVPRLCVDCDLPSPELPAIKELADLGAVMRAVLAIS